MSAAADISPGPSNSLSLEPLKSGNYNLKDDIEKETAQLQHHTTQETKLPEYIAGIPLGLVILSIFLVTFLTFLDTSIISTAIPRITDDFHSLPDVGWYGSAYQLASATLQPLTGKIYTYFPSKWCYLVFFGLFELGSLLCGAANSSKMLIVGRAVAGMGSSGIVNGGLTILASSLPLEKRAIYTGLLLGFSQLGMVLGPLIGGALTEVGKLLFETFSARLDDEPLMVVVVLDLALVFLSQPARRWPCRSDDTRDSYSRPDGKGKRIAASAIPEARPRRLHSFCTRAYSTVVGATLR